MKRFVAVMLVVLLVSALGVLAQETPAVTIPVDDLGSTTELSPDDELLALYYSAVIYDDEPMPELFPITLLNINTGEKLGSLSGYNDWVTDIAFNSDGSELVSMHRNGDIRLWDVANQSLIKTFETYTFGGGWVQFLPDDQTILYRAGEFVIATLNIESGAITRLYGRHVDSYAEFSERMSDYRERTNYTLLIGQVSPDGRWLIASTGNDEVLRWDLEAGGEPTTLRPPSEQGAQFAIRAFVFSADSSIVTYFDQTDKLIHRLDVEDGSEVSTQPGALAFAVSSDGMKIAWADRDTGAVFLADVGSTDEPTTVFTLPEDVRVAPNLTALAFTSDGLKLVVGGLYPYSEESPNAIYVFDLTK